MRETKDQKIIRLERKVKELEGYIKTLKAGNRQFKKELKQGMNTKEFSHKSDVAFFSNSHIIQIKNSVLYL